MRSLILPAIAIQVFILLLVDARSLEEHYSIYSRELKGVGRGRSGSLGGYYYSSNTRSEEEENAEHVIQPSMSETLEAFSLIFSTLLLFCLCYYCCWKKICKNPTA